MPALMWYDHRRGRIRDPAESGGLDSWETLESAGDGIRVPACLDQVWTAGVATSCVDREVSIPMSNRPSGSTDILRRQKRWVWVETKTLRASLDPKRLRE